MNAQQAQTIANAVSKGIADRLFPIWSDDVREQIEESARSGHDWVCIHYPNEASTKGKVITELGIRLQRYLEPEGFRLLMRPGSISISWAKC